MRHTDKKWEFFFFRKRTSCQAAPLQFSNMQIYFTFIGLQY